MYSYECIMDAPAIASSIRKMSYDIMEASLEGIAFIGIKNRGDILARRFVKVIEEQIGTRKVLFGTLDISLYRDDFSQLDENLVIGKTDILFDVSGKRIILVDDVLHTGRTIRAALDQIVDFGRPSSIELAILVDRGGRELPIAPDYCAKKLLYNKDKYIRANLEELDGKDEVLCISKK